MTNERWTLKGVEVATRNLVADHATKRRMSHGAWVTEAIHRQVNHERGIVVDKGQDFVRGWPGLDPPNLPAPAAATTWLTGLKETAAAAEALRALAESTGRKLPAKLSRAAFWLAQQRLAEAGACEAPKPREPGTFARLVAETPARLPKPDASA